MGMANSGDQAVAVTHGVSCANGAGSALAERFKSKASGFVRNRAVNVTLLIQFGVTALLVQVQQGRVVSITDLESLPPLASWDFSIKGGAQAWQQFWQPVPAPGSHDIFALTRNGQVEIEGNLHPFMAHLQYFKDLLAVGRQELA